MKRSLLSILIIVALALGFVGGTLSLSFKGNCFSKKSRKPLFAVTEHKPFVIIVPSYNNGEWAERNLRSIVSQKYDNYRVIYIDDASTDGQLKIVNDFLTFYQVEHRFEVIHNLSNKGACENIYNAIQSCLDGEIVVILDGDDWFAHDRVLERLNEIYANPNVWLTYGSYIEYPSYTYTVANFAQLVPEKILEKNSVREYAKQHWCFSHLRTFYASLYKKIKQADLLFDGKYYDAANDVAIMIPLVEMAGKHVEFVPEILYIYNRATPLNDNKLRAKRQQEIAEHIYSLSKYASLASLDNAAL
jgi:glycosyltransferase involved in cell wall biosynthesis